MKIAEMAEKPREKAMLSGFESLSDAELLALIIESGTKQNSAFDLALKILSECGSIQQIHQLSFAQLTSLSGIKKAKAMRLLGCIEIAKRMRMIAGENDIIKTAKDVFLYLENRLMHEKQERFIALYLDTKHHIIREKTLFIGSLDVSLVHPREVFKEALHISAACIIVAHNHPSGDPTPSKADIEITHTLIETGNIMQIPLLDHVIIGRRIFFSFRESGFFEEVSSLRQDL